MRHVDSADVYLRRAAGIFLAIVLTIAFESKDCLADTHILHFVKAIGAPSGWMDFVAFSPDGSMVASGYEVDNLAGILTIWSFPEGKLIKRIPVESEVMSPDWRYLSTYSDVRNIETGRTLAEIPYPHYGHHAFSPDSRLVVETSGRGDAGSPSLHVFDLASGRQLAEYGYRVADSVAVSPDGRTLASGYWNVIFLRDLFSGRRKAVLRGVGRYAQSMAFSPDGGVLAVGDDYGTMQIWDIARRRIRRSITAEGLYVSQPSFSPDGRLVAFGVYGTGTVYLVDVATGKLVDHQKISDIGCGSVAFSPDGRYLITVSTGGLIKWPEDHSGTIRVFRVGNSRKASKKMN